MTVNSGDGKQNRVAGVPSLNVTASAPGKILWLGGYSVLERGNTAYVSTVDARARAKIAPADEIRLIVPQFSINSKASFGNGTLRLESEKKEAVFSKNAVGASLQYLSSRGTKLKNFSIESSSDAAFSVGSGKSGLGSSAAATAATVAAVLSFHGENDIAVIHNVSQVAHSRAQGKVGSGFDVAAAVFGSCRYMRFGPSAPGGFPENAQKKWDYSVEAFPLPEVLHLAFATFPKESAATVSMVKKVLEWKAAHPGDYEELIRELDVANVGAAKCLERMRGGIPEKENLRLFRENFEKGRALARELGDKSGAPIEPESVRKLVDDSMQNGAYVCKSPGAGGKDALAALCSSPEDARSLSRFWNEKGLDVLDVKTDNRGLMLS